MRERTPRKGIDRRDFLKGAAAGAVGIGLSGGAARILLAAEKKKGPAPEMARRRFGRTGIEGSVIVYGGGGLGPAAVSLLEAAFDNGINVFDVAWGYGRGQAEVAIGKFLEKRKVRDKVILTTKASGFRPPRGTAKEVYQALKKAVEASLERMRTDHVDVLFWPHGASDPRQLENDHVRAALRDLRKAKLIRHFGTSSHTNYVRTCEAAIRSGFYEILMPVANLCTQNPEKAVAGEEAPPRRGRRRRGRKPLDTRDMLKLAKKKDVGIIAMKVANPGFLTSKTDDLLSAAFPGASPLSRHQKLYSWLLGQEGVSAVVVGIRSASHLKEAIAVGRAARGD